MGKVNKFRNVLALTSAMEIRYLKPVPLGVPLTVTGYEQTVEGRKHINIAEIRNDQGQVLARSTGTFIAIDPEKMFARHLPPLPAGATQPGTKA
jgi:acyl-CoA thioesterase FadM